MDINELLNSPFSFKERKAFIPCDTRPLWKVSLVILILGLLGKDYKCSLKKLHTANWLTKDSDHLNEIISWTESNSLFSPLIRMDPTLDRAIELAAAYGYASKYEGKIALTQLGIKFFQEISKSEVMQEERKILASVKRHLSEAAVERIFKAN